MSLLFPKKMPPPPPRPKAYPPVGNPIAGPTTEEFDELAGEVERLWGHLNTLLDIVRDKVNRLELLEQEMAELKEVVGELHQPAPNITDELQLPSDNTAAEYNGDLPSPAVQ